jgi:hypothetical protein
LDQQNCKQKTITTSTTETALLNDTAKDHLGNAILAFTDIDLDLEDANNVPIICNNKQNRPLQQEQPKF